MYQMYHSEEVGMFYTYVLGYMILYMTLALVNSVAFKQDENFKILEFGNYMYAGLCYIFHWDSPEGVTQGLLKTLFFYQELPH
jgi:hypothetical protein